MSQFLSRSRFFFIIGSVLLVSWLTTALYAQTATTSTTSDTAAVDDRTHIIRIDKTFESDHVIEAIENGLISQGLLARGVMHLEDMLSRTGEDWGQDSLYLMADSVEFCSAKQTYLMAAADDRNLSHCPFTILAYVSRDEPDVTYIMYQLPTLWGSGDALAKSNAGIEKMFADIMAETLFFLQ